MARGAYRAGRKGLGARLAGGGVVVVKRRRVRSVRRPLYNEVQGNDTRPPRGGDPCTGFGAESCVEAVGRDRPIGTGW